MCTLSAILSKMLSIGLLLQDRLRCLPVALAKNCQRSAMMPQFTRNAVIKRMAATAMHRHMRRRWRPITKTSRSELVEMGFAATCV